MSSVRYLKDKVLDGRRISLDLNEVLISLAIPAANNPSAGDEAGLRKLGINLTSDPLFASKLMVED